MIKFREYWCGYLWQGWFDSFLMDEPYLIEAATYVELNPVKAKMVRKPEDCCWSSSRAHIKGKDSPGIVEPENLLNIWQTVEKPDLPPRPFEQAHGKTSKSNTAGVSVSLVYPEYAPPNTPH